MPVQHLCLLLSVLLVQLQHIILRHPGPAFTVNVVQIDLASAVSISIGGLVDRSTGQLTGLLYGQVIAQAAVQGPVGIHGARTHGKQVTTHTVPLGVHIVETWSEREGEGEREVEGEMKGNERP